MKKIFSILILVLVFVIQSVGQVLKDSTKAIAYPYSLPILGAKAAAKGYDLPYSAGLSVNYLWQQSDLIINDLFVGFNNGPMHDLDEIIRFNSSVATASAINFRPDIWVLPFLNVYGIFAKAKTSTEINAGVWIPDETNTWHEVTSFSSKANFDATGVGFGITPTIGVGGGFLALDMNMTWTDVSALEKPVYTLIFGPRFGKSFKFKKPDRNIAFWAGGFRLHLSSTTEGSILLSEVLPVDGLQTKVNDGLTKVADTQIKVDEWWNELTPQEQNNPVNAHSTVFSYKAS